MKALGQLITHRYSDNRGRSVFLDEKTVFHVFMIVLRDEYGRRGVENITPFLFHKKKLHVEAKKSHWGHEVWMARDSLCRVLNDRLGEGAVKEICVGKK